MTLLTNTFIFLEKIGLTDVILPFILVFTIVFATLEKSGFFKEGKTNASQTNINAMLSLIIGFIVVASSYQVAIIQKIIQNTTIVLLALFSVILILSFFGYQKGDFKHINWIYFGIFGILIIIFLYALELINLIDMNTIKNFLGNQLLIIFLVILLILKFVLKNPNKKQIPKNKKSFENKKTTNSKEEKFNVEGHQKNSGGDYEWDRRINPPS